MSELRLDVGLANELKLALRVARGADGSEWEDRDVKALVGNTNLLGGLLDCLRGNAEIVIKVVEEVAKALFVLVKTITIPATPEKKTAKCFTDKERYSYRDPALDTLLPKAQKARGEENGTVNQLTEKSNFIGMVQSLLGVVESGINALSGLLIRSNQIYTLTQIEVLIELQENGVDVGLLTNSWATFFLVLNKQGGVSVVSVFRYDGQWDVYVRSLDDDYVWRAEIRFFSRN